MDPLAHTLVGAAVARLPTARRTSLGAAAAVVGANLPDVDVLSYAVSPDYALGFRRGWTHGVLALAVLPLLLAGTLAYLQDRRDRSRGETPEAVFGPLLFVSALAVWTHPVLDWLNTYGIRLLMPFDGRWLYGDSVFIIEPWIWLVLGGGVILAAPTRRRRWAFLGIGGLVTVVIAAAPTALLPWQVKGAWLVVAATVAVAGASTTPAGARASGDRLILGGLVAVAAYAVLAVALSTAGRRLVGERLPALGVPVVEDLMMSPRPADPLHWGVVVKTPESYRFARLSWEERPRVALEDRVIPRRPPGSLVAAARAVPQVRGLVQWARFPWYTVEPGANGETATVFILDARYTRRKTRGFGGAAVKVRSPRWLPPPGEGSAE